MKPDILTSEDIALLVNTFYEKVKKDTVIGGFFSSDKINWERHLPKMYKFWENVVFYSGGYTGNPMEQHKILHKQSPIGQKDFDRWIELFKQTVDELFEGENAENIKLRAVSISTIMSMKLLDNQLISIH